MHTNNNGAHKNITFSRQRSRSVGLLPPTRRQPAAPCDRNQAGWCDLFAASSGSRPHDAQREWPLAIGQPRHVRPSVDQHTTYHTFIRVSAQLKLARAVGRFKDDSEQRALGWEMAATCFITKQQFGMFSRRHHCRFCLRRCAALRPLRPP